MANALWITLIGMGLVFIAILLLWGGMALLVLVTTEREVREPADEVASQEAALVAAQGSALETNGAERTRRAAVAAAAVSAALALRKTTRPAEQGRPDGGLSAWQAVNRARQINQTVNNSRKKVVR